MITQETKSRYPQNIFLKGLIAVSPYTITEIAEKIEVSRNVVNLTVNGHYKGDNIVSKILTLLGPEFLAQYKDLLPKSLDEKSI